MTITSYSTLQTEIAEFISWDDSDARIPTFIQLAEQQMNRSVRHWRMEKRTSSSVSTQYADIPTDFLEPIRLQITGVHRPLRLESVHTLQDERNRVQDASGIPYAYALTAGKIELFPTPSEPQTLEILYYAPIDALTEGDPGQGVAAVLTNWVLDSHADAYLYGALMHSAPYLGEDARITTWATLYANAISEINGTADDGKFGGAKRKRLRTA